MIITAIDFETTGTVTGYETDAWQIGLVQVIDGHTDTKQMYDSLLHVDDRPFNPYAPGIHHQLRDQLKCAPHFHEVWLDIQPWLSNCILCAHNIGTEKKFLQRYMPLHRFGPWIDTLKLARIAWPDAPSHKLEDLVVNLGIEKQAKDILPGRESHDALFDALCSALLLEYLLAQPGWKQATASQLIAAKPIEFHRLRSMK